MIKNQQRQHDCLSIPEFKEHNPRISIFIRFEPNMKKPGVLESILAHHAEQSEAELLKQYPEEMVKPVTKKLRNVMKGIKNDGHQSLAIFVCPVSEKVIYFTYNPYLSEFSKIHPLRGLKLNEK
ncbi:MAG: hypothetical protein ABI366_05950 [Ginsengibacter sp.]